MERGGAYLRFGAVNAALILLILQVACGRNALPQDLTISGTRSAHVTSATLAGQCSPPSNQGQGFATQLVGSVGSDEFDLYIEVRTWQGQIDYGPTVEDAYGAKFPTVTVKVGVTTYTSRYGSGSVSPAQTTGRLDMDLTEDSKPDGRALHIAGSWRCA